MEQVAEEPHVCDECGNTYGTSMGLSRHKTVAHRKVSADKAFELVAAATDALFPQGVPSARIIEVAELQKAMLKVVAS